LKLLLGVLIGIMSFTFILSFAITNPEIILDESLTMRDSIEVIKNA